MHLRPVLAAVAATSTIAIAATVVLANQDRSRPAPEQVAAMPLFLAQAGRPAAPACADPAPVGITFSSGTVHVPNHGEAPALIVEGVVTNHGPGAVPVSTASHEARLHFHWGDSDPIQVASLSLAGLGVGESQAVAGTVPMDTYQWLYSVHGAPRVTLHIDAERVDCDTAGLANTAEDYGPAPTAM